MPGWKHANYCPIFEDKRKDDSTCRYGLLFADRCQRLDTHGLPHRCRLRWMPERRRPGRESERTSHRSERCDELALRQRPPSVRGLVARYGPVRLGTAVPATNARKQTPAGSKRERTRDEFGRADESGRVRSMAWAYSSVVIGRANGPVCAHYS